MARRQVMRGASSSEVATTLETGQRRTTSLISIAQAKTGMCVCEKKIIGPPKTRSLSIERLGSIGDVFKLFYVLDLFVFERVRDTL